MTTTIGDKVDRERTKRLIKHASHNQKDHGNRDGVTLKPSQKTKTLQSWTSNDFRNFDHVKSYIKGREAEEGGAWAFDSVFGYVTLVRASTPSKVPDDYVGTTGSNNKYFWKGKWHDFSDAVRIREQNRGLIQKHGGPGDHPGGTPQSTHGRGGRNSSTKDIKETTDTKGGVTIRTMSGERPESGFAVALSEHGLKVPTARATSDRVGKYIREKWDTLSKEGFFLGTWKDDEKGVVWLDVSKVMDSENYSQAFESAVKFGQRGGEDAIYDLKNGVEIQLNEEAISQYRQELAA